MSVPPMIAVVTVPFDWMPPIEIPRVTITSPTDGK